MDMVNDMARFARRHFFSKALKVMLDLFNSSHPFDKEIIIGLLDGGMTKEEVKQFRDLTLKAAKAYYKA